MMQQIKNYYDMNFGNHPKSSHWMFKGLLYLWGWNQQHINHLFTRKLYIDLIYWTMRPLCTDNKYTSLIQNFSFQNNNLKNEVWQMCLPSKILMRLTHGTSQLSGASGQREAKHSDCSCRGGYVPWTTRPGWYKLSHSLAFRKPAAGSLPIAI